MLPCSLSVLFISLDSLVEVLEVELALTIYDPNPKKEFATDWPVCIHNSI